MQTCILLAVWKGLMAGKALLGSSEARKKPINLDLMGLYAIKRPLWMTPLLCSFVLSLEEEVRTQFYDTCYPSQLTAMEVPHQATNVCTQAHPNDVDGCS